MTIPRVALLLTLCITAQAFSQEAPMKIVSPFTPLMPFVGKTWRGTLPGSTAEKPAQDISRWELVLNGQAIRIIHSVNDGEYGGETMIVWDNTAKKLVYFYFTTAGFYTSGSFEIDGNRFTSVEKVTGNANGITEVRSTSEILPDGRLHSRAQYLKDGKWIDGHEFYYVEDPAAVVRFR